MKASWSPEANQKRMTSSSIGIIIKLRWDVGSHDKWEWLKLFGKTKLLQLRSGVEENRAKLINYWLNTAKEDLKVADHLFEKKDYRWALFVAHLVLEKVLKGYYVKQVDKQVPYTHSLRYLAQQVSLELNEEQKELLRTVTRFNIEARYASEKSDFYKLCTKDYTEGYLNRIKEFYQWMLKKF